MKTGEHSRLLKDKAVKQLKAELGYKTKYNILKSSLHYLKMNILDK